VRSLRFPFETTEAYRLQLTHMHERGTRQASLARRLEAPRGTAAAMWNGVSGSRCTCELAAEDRLTTAAVL
jgi:hypothetical protein